MKIGEEHIVTPEDDLVEFSADWRYLASRAWKSYGDRVSPRKWLKADQPMSEFRTYLVKMDKYDNDYTRLPDELQKYRFPLQWYNAANISSMRFKLEALLLTGATYEIIAKDLLGDRGGPELIEVYAKLFFDVRNANGSLDKSNQRRMWLSVPAAGHVDGDTDRATLWKFIGTHLGYAGLVWMWCMPDPNGNMNDLRFKQDELMRMAQAILLERFARGQISNFDLNQFAMYTVNRERTDFDTGKGDLTENKTMNAALKMLSFLGPKLVRQAKTVDEHKAETKAIQARLDAQQTVLQQQIPDAGAQAGYDSINELMSQRVSENQAR